jgi:hypothetical protein
MDTVYLIIALAPLLGRSSPACSAGRSGARRALRDHRSAWAVLPAVAVVF